MAPGGMKPQPVEDASGYRGQADRLLTPVNEAELVTFLVANREPVTVVGALSGVTGGAVPTTGVAISLAKFDRCEIGRGMARVGAGLLLADLQVAAKASKQFYAPDPTYNGASMGGTFANNASGSRSFRFGSTRRHVLALRAVFMDGTVREFRRGEAIDFDVPRVTVPATTKHQAGYPLEPGMDWIDVLIGSEGTLAILTEATVRLLPAPAELLSGVLFFPSEAAALAAVDAWRTLPQLRMLEYFDAESLNLLREVIPESPRCAAALLIEQEGDDTGYLDSAPIDEASWFGTTDADRERFRKFRHALPERVNDTVRRNGYLKMGTDYAVPPGRNAEMIARYREMLDPTGIRYVIYGHIGDAHVHVNMLPATAEQARQSQRFLHDFAHEAVLRGGTVGAEHGLGKRKRDLLSLLYSGPEIEAMKAVKRRLDPRWLLGQGNLFPCEPASCSPSC
ncbi:MAG: FAD-binding oxidoreductase [Acidobacteriota bacterium]